MSDQIDEKQIQMSFVKEGGDPEPQEEGKDEAPAEEEASAGSKVASMRPGDYTVHIHIQQLRNIEMIGESSCTPQVFVHMINQTGKTTKRDNIFPTAITKVDEHLYLECDGLTGDQISKANIKIEVMNVGFFKNDLIGAFEIAASKIHMMPQNTLKHRQVGISSPDAADGSKPTGMIACSINVIGPGDEAQELKMATEAELISKPPLMPTSIKKEYKQVTMRFIRAESLPNMDTGIFNSGNNDVYVLVKYAHIHVRTVAVTQKKERVQIGDTSKDVETAHIMQEVMFPLETPLSQDFIQIEVYDQDFLTKDDLIASFKINCDDILQYNFTEESDERALDGSRRSMRWMNLYGGPHGASGAVYNYMNENSEKASAWAGRILLEFFYRDDKFPKTKVTKIQNDAVFEEEMEYTMQPKKYFFIGQIAGAIALPYKDVKKLQNLKIKFKIGEQEKISSFPKQVEEEYCRWNFEFQETYEETFQDISRLPDVFVYLMEDDQPICYWRDNVARFTEQPDAETEWLALKTDQAIGKVTSLHKAGFFSLRLFVQELKGETSFNKKEYKQWNRGMARRNNAYKLRVAVYQCQNLPPCDENGSSDPYIEVWSSDPNSRVRTQVCNDTNNPVYYEVIQTNLEIPNIDEAPPLLLDMYDSEAGEGFLGMDGDDDFMGRAVIYLNRVHDLSRGDRIPAPKWYPVKFNEDDGWDQKDGAAMLVSLCLLDFDFQPVLSVDQIKLDEDMFIDEFQGRNLPYPKPDLMMKAMKCEINALGLRQLVSDGILPISKGYVKFKLKSMLKNEAAKAIQEIQTLPKEKGPNPNINTTLQFEVKIPSMHLYCPRLTCEAYDQKYFEAFPQPIIGSFMLPIGQARFDGKMLDEEKIFELERSGSILAIIRNKLEKDRARGDVANRLRTQAIIDECEEIIESESPIKKDVIQRFAEDLDIDQQFKSSKYSRSRRALKRLKTQLQKEEEEEMTQLQKKKTIQRKQTLAEQQKSKEEHTSKRKQAEAKEKARIAKEKEEREAKRKQEQAELTSGESKRKEAFANIIEPKYRYDERLLVDVEYDIPPESLFMGVGYDARQNGNPSLVEAEASTTTSQTEGSEAGNDIPAALPMKRNKHYRRYFPDELENARNDEGEMLITSPFLMVPIYRAQVKPKKGGGKVFKFFTGLAGGSAPPEELQAAMEIKQVGKFKCRITVFNEELKNQRREQQAKGFTQLKAAIEMNYNMEHQYERPEPRKFDSALWDHFDPEKEQEDGEPVTFETVLKYLRELSDYLNESGLTRLQLDKQIGSIVGGNLLENLLRKQIPARARIYMLEGYNMAKRDLFSESDPYLIMRCGETEFNERDIYQLDTNKPTFFKSYEFSCQFPGAPCLEIEVWDYDDFFGDDLIGKSQLELDDRYFSMAWQAIDDKPIEYRDLYIDGSLKSQGVVKCWIEIDEQSSKRFEEEARNIAAEPVEEFECRLVIWKTADLEFMDFEGCSDAYVKAYFENDEDQETDIHWRNSDGAASFNWRMLFDLKSKQLSYDLTIQAWDKDIIAWDDFIGAFQFPIDPLFTDSKLTGRQFTLTKEYFDDHFYKENCRLRGVSPVRDPNNPEEAPILGEDIRDTLDRIKFDSNDKNEDKFWVPVRRLDKDRHIEPRKGCCCACSTCCCGPERETGADGMIEGGRVLISLTVLPKAKAMKNQLGKGRDDLNAEPFLPPPEGRIELSLNPFTMLAQLCPPRLRGYICMCLCCLLCIVLAVYMLPMIASNGLSKLLFPA